LSAPAGQGQAATPSPLQPSPAIVALALLGALGTFLVLPLFGTLSQRRIAREPVRTLDVDVIAPPPLVRMTSPPRPQQPRPEVPAPPETPPPPDAPAPREAPLPPIEPARLDLGYARADFALDFSPRPVRPGQAAPDEDAVLSLGAVDQAPRPRVKVEPVYPLDARRHALQGRVVAEFTVGADGRVRDATVVSAQPAEVFERAVLSALKQWRFEPARHRGKNVAVRVRSSFVFELEDEW
jgi:protein TonB